MDAFDTLTFIGKLIFVLYAFSFMHTVKDELHDIKKLLEKERDDK